MGSYCNGEFSVKLAHRIQNDVNQEHRFKGLLNKIRKLNIPHKVKFFGWLLVRNKLTTNTKLHKFNNNNSALCPLCNNAEENIGHRIQDCFFAQELWKIDGNLPVISLLPSINDWLNSLEYIDKQDLSDISKVLFLWWQMLNDINDFIFKQIKPNAIRSFKTISSIAKNFLPANSKGKVADRFRSNNNIRWHPPDADYHKINFDGSIVGTFAAAGFIIRNQHGRPFYGEVKKVGS